MQTFKVHGIKELRAKLKGLPFAIQKQVLQPATRYGANVIAEQARAIVRNYDDPETGRQIADNIVVRYRARRSRRNNAIIYSIGVLYPHGRIPKGNPDDGVNTPHWHLLELGTEKMAARPFLVPATIMRSEDVLVTIAERASRRLERMKI